jgi:hypothetical protein
VIHRKDGLHKGKDELLKGKLMLEHSLGLGQRPNVIPSAEGDINGELRAVEVAWHPVAGFAGKWFAEKTGLGKKITERVNHYPDPTQHWAVLVGDYCHELWMVLSTYQIINYDHRTNGGTRMSIWMLYI